MDLLRLVAVLAAVTIAATLVVTTGFPAGGQPAPDAIIEPIPLEGLPAMGCGADMHHGIHADGGGRVVMLCGDNLAIHGVPSGRVSSDGKALRPRGPLEPVRGATVDGDGLRWTVWGRTLHLFVRGQEEEVPALPVAPDSAAFSHAGLVVVIKPVVVGTLPDTWKPFPHLVVLQGQRWQPFHRFPPRPATLATSDPFVALAFLFAGGRRALVGVQRCGRALVALRPGQPDWYAVVRGDRLRELTEDHAATRMAEAAQRHGVATEGAKFFPVKAEEAVQGLTLGRDHLVWMVATPGGMPENTVVLHRLNLVEGHLEQTLLRLSWNGRVTLAAGRDGLYLAADRARAGAWWLPWSRLENAPWQVVEDLEVSRQGWSAAPTP